jgi:hypothetical protein
MLTLAHASSRGNLDSDKAPEDWSTPRRFAHTQVAENRASVLDCGGPPPLFPEAYQTVPMLTGIAIFKDRPVVGIYAVDLVWGLRLAARLTQQQPV